MRDACAGRPPCDRAAHRRTRSPLATVARWRRAQRAASPNCAAFARHPRRDPHLPACCRRLDQSRRAAKCVTEAANTLRSPDAGPGCDPQRAPPGAPLLLYCLPPQSPAAFAKPGPNEAQSGSPSHQEGLPPPRETAQPSWGANCPALPSTQVPLAAWPEQGPGQCRVCPAQCHPANWQPPHTHQRPRASHTAALASSKPHPQTGRRAPIGRALPSVVAAAARDQRRAR